MPTRAAIFVNSVNVTMLARVVVTGSMRLYILSLQAATDLQWRLDEANLSTLASTTYSGELTDQVKQLKVNILWRVYFILAIIIGLYIK